MALSIHNTSLSRIFAKRNQIWINNPFTFRSGLVLTIIIGLVFTGLLAVSDFDWNEQYTTGFWSRQLYTLIRYLLLAALLTLFSYKIYSRCIKEPPSLPANRYITIVTVGCLVLTFIYSILVRLIGRSLSNDLGIDGVIDVAMFNDLLLGTMVVILSTLVCLVTRRQQMVLENERLQSEQLITHYETLEQQVDPHFLFNSLNTLGGLIGVDDDKALLYLQKLAVNYRYVMQQQQQHSVTLDEEMKFARNYIDMMQIRYGDNLSLLVNIDEVYLSCKIPPISIQLLLENAIKHNVVSDKHPLQITVRSTNHETIRVSNPMRPKQDSNETKGAAVESVHIGLDNLNKRYKMLYHKEIVIEQVDGVFAVELPLMTCKGKKNSNTSETKVQKIK